MGESATSSDLQKAYIQVLDAQGKVKEDGEIPVCFNPGEYSMDKSNEFANINIPGLESPLLQFVRGGLETLTMDLFFDTYTDEKPEKEKRDVRDYTDRIVNLLKIDSDLNAPPVLKFVWGSLDFTCVLSKVNKKFTMFRPDGKPVRATLSVTFNEFKTEKSTKEKPLQSRDRTKHRILKEGDSLWLIAAEEYGDPAMWRDIAIVNKIDNPRILETGSGISIPPVE